MGKKAKNIVIKQGLDGWVMTYGDMMSLLLTFFVLIVSFSSMQDTKFKQAANSLKDAFGVLARPESVIEFNDPLVPNHNPESREAEILYEVRAIEKMVYESGLEDQVEVEVGHEGVRFRVAAPFLFTSASADLDPGSRLLLDNIGLMLRKFPYKVAVEGHTDNLPIRSSRFPSNWELSSARAVSVARYFQGTGVAPENLGATGYGEFRPIADNETPDGRSRNRRVEILLQIDRGELKSDSRLPLVAPGSGTGADEPQADGNMPVRPIINPVTGRLGPRTGAEIQP
ncbi:OmpA family protein [bacterium]|nr:OmpA family protein [bacterium]